MKPVATLALACLAVIPLHAVARVDAVVCPGGHYTRAAGSEMHATGIAFRNADLENTATIERITVRNVFGDVVHDSGPAIGVPHPRSAAIFEIPGGLDITYVPPGASYFLTTTDIWGLNNIPDLQSQGFALSITVETSKRGQPDLLNVSVRSRARERFPTPTGFGEGAERSSHTGTCITVKPTVR